MNEYNVTVLFIDGMEFVYPGIRAYNKRDAKNLVICALWDAGYSKADVKHIMVEVIS